MKRIVYRLGMVAGVAIMVVMLMAYYATEQGVFETEPVGIMELREQNKTRSQKWLDGQVAWLRLDGTHIDYPVMQTKDNYWYLNHDYYGNNATSGAIFLDYRNASNFTDSVSVIYGHHMNGNLMFSDVAKYGNAEYFAEHTHGELIIPKQRIDLRVEEYREISSEDELYRDLTWNADGPALILSTCSRGNHKARDVLVLSYE